jgi:DNA-binding transcriptional LysR family regulator
LFVRTREGLRPTATAERLRAHAERMELEAAALARAAAASGESAAGVVRVAATEAMALHLIHEGLLRLREEHPDLVVEILGGNHALDLSRGEADVAVRVSPMREATLRVRCLGRMTLGLFAAPAYLRRRGLPRTPQQLGGHDVLLPAGELSRLAEARWLAGRPEVRVVFRSNSMLALVAAAAAGLGLVPMPLFWGEREPRLERALVLDHIPKRALWLVTRAEANSAATRLVCERITALFASPFAA